jgi:hypothetical protein
VAVPALERQEGKGDQRRPLEISVRDKKEIASLEIGIP